MQECVWQSATAQASLTVQVANWPNATTAETAYAAAVAAMQGFSVEDVAGFADACKIVRAPAGTISTGGIYVRKGATFFDVVYLAGSAPSDSALQQAATLVLGGLP
jgi:hypothetical protein